MVQQMPPFHPGWSVTIAALGINLILGALYAWGVIGKALAVQWQWTKTQAALPFTVSTVAFAIMMIFAGRWQDKIGPRVVATFGGVMFGLGLFASAHATAPFLIRCELRPGLHRLWGRRRPGPSPRRQDP